MVWLEGGERDWLLHHLEIGSSKYSKAGENSITKTCHNFLINLVKYMKTKWAYYCAKKSGA